MQKRNRRQADKEKKLLPKAKLLLTTIPMGVLAAALLLFAFRQSLPFHLISSLNIAAYILAGVGMALSAGFNRSRIFIILFLLAFGQFALTTQPPAGYDTKVYSDVVFYLAGILLPANILLFSLLRERGLLTPQGKVRLMVVAAELGAAAVILIAKDIDILLTIKGELASPPFGWHTAIPAKIFALFIVAVAPLVLRQLGRRLPVDSAMLGTLLVLAAAFHFREETLAIPLFFSAAAVMLTVAAIQESYSIAYLDELTGLPSRRSLQEELAKLGGQYVIAMVDIDFFKKVNDKYGHSVGDDVLRLVAAEIGREMDGAARSFRYGGEEFTLLFPGKCADEVLPYLEELRLRIAKRGFFLRGKAAAKRLSVTVSIGVAQRDTGHQTPDEVIKAADAALYRAKDSGRNCIKV